MPMGIVSDTEFDKELNKASKPQPTGSVEKIKRGRGEGDVKVPEVLRQVIGEHAVTNGRASAVELAKAFGISPSSTSAYSVGANSTSTYNERPGEANITKAKDLVTSKARKKLILALSHITPEKLESAKARDLAGVAKDMSAVIKNMEPAATPSGIQTGTGPTFVFYSPTIKEEKEYEVVRAKE